MLHLRVSDAESAPLAGMVPVATEGPGLLSKIVSQGEPTGADGEGDLVLPRDKWVYVRAEDPSGKLIAVDSVEFQPGDAIEADESVDLVMGDTASVSATLRGEDGSPISDAAVELLMFHPAHGQWWRAESNVEGAGRVQFDGLPAGVYALKLRAGDTFAATFREIVLPEGGVEDLGIVSPQPSE